MAEGKDIKHCFLVKTRYLRKMTSGEKACLVLHEVLRFLPESKKFKNEIELRRTAYHICTAP
jgi:hypothetical protein